jgi:hypothetical protein
MKINALRLSFVVTETILDLQRGAGAAMPLGSFVSEPGYVDIVDAVQRGDAAPLDLRMPWPYPAGHHFWDAYMRDKVPGDARGKLCFEKLVPLRLPKLAEKIEMVVPELAPAATARIGIEGLYYPYGTGLLVTAALDGELDIPATGRFAHALRYDKVYKSPWPARVAGLLNLDQLMTATLDQLRELGFGSGMSGVRSTPFSIVTVVRGAEIDPSLPVVPDGKIHRLLNGLAGWVRGWPQLSAPELVAGSTQLQLKSKTAWRGNLLFAEKRGRAVWFPGQFLPASPPAHGLGCYHRNLSIGSLQVESLLMLAAATEDAHTPGALVPASIQRLGRLAAGLLARFHSGKKSYRSDSFRAQIAQSEQLADVNALRQRFGMPTIP